MEGTKLVIATAALLTSALSLGGLAQAAGPRPGGALSATLVQALNGFPAAVDQPVLVEDET